MCSFITKFIPRHRQILVAPKAGRRNQFSARLPYNLGLWFDHMFDVDGQLVNRFLKHWTVDWGHHLSSTWPQTQCLAGLRPFLTGSSSQQIFLFSKIVSFKAIASHSLAHPRESQTCRNCLIDENTMSCTTAWASGLNLHCFLNSTLGVDATYCYSTQSKWAQTGAVSFTIRFWD